MRVGLVIEEFDPSRGGVEQWTAQFTERLLERGHEVHVVARRFSSQTLATPIVAHPLGRVPSRVGFAEAAQRMVQSLDLDVVHDTGCGWSCDVFQPHGGSRAAAARRNLLLSPRWMRPIKRAVSGLLPRYREFDALSARQYADDGRLVLALSRRVAADFVHLHGVRPERIRLIYNGVDTRRFSPERRPTYRETIRRRLGISPETTLLLIVAHNFRLKGVPMLLRAMSAWNDRRPLHLAVVGGKHVERFARKARRMGLKDRVTFVGPVDDTVPFYTAADVYVQPTFYDPCSLVVLEALAAGLPVVTSRQNGASELMTEGVHGHMLDDPADTDRFLACVESLMDADRREQIGRAARRLALEHTLDQNVDEVIAVYEEINRERRHAAVTGTASPFVCRRTGGDVARGQAPVPKSGVPS